MKKLLLAFVLIPAVVCSTELDTTTILVARKSLSRVADFARTHPDLFGAAAEATPFLDERQKTDVLQTWGEFMDALLALDDVGRRNADFLKMKGDARVKAFERNEAAFLAGYRWSLEWIGLVQQSGRVKTLLNEAYPSAGIQSGTFDDLAFRFANVARAAEFAAYQSLDRTMGNLDLTLRKTIDEDSKRIWELGRGQGELLTAKNATAVVGNVIHSVWFPVQENAATWMGDARVIRGHESWITKSQIVDLHKRLKPGDIFIERREWYLSNLGLPGFWTHAALYVGLPKEREALVDKEVKDWLKDQGQADGNFEAYLATHYTNAYETSLKATPDGPARVLEAISEGVSFTALEHSAAADSLGVLRPNVSNKEKAIAIARAFGFAGRPYDFDFDFGTDSALVCSELIYKVYQPSENLKGIRFLTAPIAGKMMSTPNQMADLFNQEFGQPTAQLSLVLFLDGHEKEKKAIEASAEEFRGTTTRPKWHVFVQKPSSK